MNHASLMVQQWRDQGMVTATNVGGAWADEALRALTDNPHGRFGTGRG